MLHEISPDLLTLDRLKAVFSGPSSLKLSDTSRKAIEKCRNFLEKEIARTDVSHYGINTGFGSLCNITIPDEDIEQLQYNLIVSHAAGTGDPVPPEIVRIMLLLKIQSLSYGYSGVRVETVERLIDFYNLGIYPMVYELGSLGASGDLAPLAHLCLPMIGLGECFHMGRRMTAAEALSQNGLQPLRFQAKEALALLNGTQFSAAYAVWALIESDRLLEIADYNAALGYEGFDCRLSPLNEVIHKIRPHRGQTEVAAALRKLLEGSEIANGEKKAVQDPYAFRCVPQVHGASRDAVAHAKQMTTVEINSVTDNPILAPDEGLILSGGNFHAQPLALPLDYLAIALSEIANISERRLYQLISGQRGLPPFLTDNPGLHSGMMIAQYTAASIVSQNKTLCTPASVDSIVSSNGQEDHVSMAANAATKLYRVARNVHRALALEFMVAMQALEYRRPLKSSPRLESLFHQYRAKVPRLGPDRILHDDIEATLRFLERGLQEDNEAV